MRDGYLSKQFASDFDRLGFKATRKISSQQLDALEAALTEVGEGEVDAVLDDDARTYIRVLHERAAGRPLRAPDLEEVVQGSTFLPDPTDPKTVAASFDTSGDVAPAGLLCLGEWKSGEIWILDVAVPAGYVFLITERRDILPVFRSIGDFARWAVANELWKRRMSKDNEVPERLGRIRFFKSVAFLREAGLVPQTFKPKRFKPKYHLPTALDREPPAV